MRQLAIPSEPRRSRTIDLETRVTGDHHRSLRIWLRLLSCTNLIEGHVRQRLTAGFNMTLPRFDLMAQLERAPAGLQMGELSRRMMVTGGNITGITDLLEKDGLVVREVDPEDRRAFRVKITRAGRSVFEGMAAEHERWIVGVFAGLTEREKQTLGKLLLRLKSQFGTGGGAPEGS